MPEDIIFCENMSKCTGGPGGNGNDEEEDFR